MTLVAITTPFDTATNIVSAEYEEPGIFQRGVPLTRNVCHDEAALKMLAMSPLRDELEELRDMLNEALGQPKPSTPDNEVEEARRYLVECRKLMWAAVNEWKAANCISAADAEARQVAHDNLYETEKEFCDAFIRFHDLADIDEEV